MTGRAIADMILDRRQLLSSEILWAAYRIDGDDQGARFRIGTIP